MVLYSPLVLIVGAEGAAPGVMTQSWVVIGGAKADIARNGAPHKPGTIYMAKANEMMARNRRLTLVLR